MKKLLALSMCLILSLSLVACGNDNSSSSSSSSTTSSSDSSSETSSAESSTSSSSASGAVEQTARAMFDNIVDKVGMNSPEEVSDDAMLTDLYYLEKEWLDEYVIAAAMMNVSSDNLAVIKATEGNADKVAEALEKRRSDVENSFAQYLPEQYEKAQNGLVKTQGDWVFLVILDDIPAAEELIDGYFA